MAATDDVKDTLRFPDELTEAILDKIQIHTVPREERLPYLLVCRKWTAMLERQLFRHIHVSFDETHRWRLAELLNILDARPQLLQHVISLAINSSDNNSDWMFTHLLRVFDLFSNTLRDLNLITYVYDENLPPLYYRAVQERLVSILRRIGSMPHIRTLSVCDFLFGDIITALQDSSIQSLTLWLPRWSYTETTKLWRQIDNWQRLEDRFEVPPCRRDQLSTWATQGLPKFPGPEYLRTSRIQSLTLSGAKLSTSEIHQFLQWPARLEILVLESVTLPYIPTSSDWHQMLLPHRDSLRVLSLNNLRAMEIAPDPEHPIGNIADADLDFTCDYPCLETLNIDNFPADCKRLHMVWKRTWIFFMLVSTTDKRKR